MDRRNCDHWRSERRPRCNTILALWREEGLGPERPRSTTDSVCNQLARREVSLAPSQRPNAFSRYGSVVSRREQVNDCRACLGDNLVLGIRPSGATDCADNLHAIAQGDAASRRNHSVERKQIGEMHKLDTVLEDLCRAPERRACSSLVFRNL